MTPVTVVEKEGKVNIKVENHDNTDIRQIETNHRI